MIELYATGDDPTMPMKNASDDVAFLDDFDTIEEAAEYADCNGCGWYLWSRPEDGKYLGSILVVQGCKPEVHEF